MEHFGAPYCTAIASNNSVLITATVEFISLLLTSGHHTASVEPFFKFL